MRQIAFDTAKRCWFVGMFCAYVCILKMAAIFRLKFRCAR